jgi:hypothetical protein
MGRSASEGNSQFQLNHSRTTIRCGLPEQRVGLRSRSGIELWRRADSRPLVVFEGIVEFAAEGGNLTVVDRSGKRLVLPASRGL